MSTTPALIELRGVSKRFGHVTALDDVSIRVEAGRVTCLLGGNGAGKSTLLKILAGVHQPSTGPLLLDGEPVRLGSPRDARARGIATVYQDLAVLPLMSVWRNFFLGSEPTLGAGPFRRIDAARCRSTTLAELATLGIALADPDQPAGTLSGGERQAVALARALHFGARILILDEPTAALGVRQSERVLENIARVRQRGGTVLLVTHDPRHALAVGDRFTVLSHGRVIAEREREGVSLEELVLLMAGETAGATED